MDTIVGFDGSDGSAAALRWALEDTDGPVRAVATWQAPVAAAPPWVVVPVIDEAQLMAEQRSRLDELLAEVAGGDAGRVTLDVLAGPAGPKLVDAARGAHVLALGRRGHGGFLGLLLGSVSEYCVHHATCPVALVPTDPPPSSGRIVVGFDGSENSTAALRWAAAEAQRRDATLVALHSWSWLDQPVPKGGQFDPDFDDDAARRYAEEAVAACGIDRPVHVEVVNDLPARALVERSAAGDVVVVGSRGHGAVRQALLGSVSRQVTQHATSPVVVVPPAS